MSVWRGTRLVVGGGIFARALHDVEVGRDEGFDVSFSQLGEGPALELVHVCGWWGGRDGWIGCQACAGAAVGAAGCRGGDVDGVVFGEFESSC